MLTQDNVKTITDIREKTQALLKQVQKTLKPLYILYHSKPQAVLLSLEEYNKLRDIAEDYYDSLRAQEYESQDKKKIKWVSHGKMLKEIKLDK